jgi:hypothetical protein
MNLLELHLRDSGFPYVHQFHWSGGYIDSLRRGVCQDYADHLARIWRVENPEQDLRIDIFAKSNGGFIAEAALKLLLQTVPDINIGTLLRVGIPDPRERPDTPLANHVVTVVSHTDPLYRIGLLAWRYLGIHMLFPEGAVVTRTRYKRIVLSGLSHGNLNYPVRCEPSFERSTYDVYSEILSNRGSVQ